jgi:hypothetical protein
VVATTFGLVFILFGLTLVSASGKRDSPAQRQMAQNRLQAENGIRGDRNAYVEAPPIAGLWIVSGKSAGSKDCVVDLIGFELPTTRLWPLT